MDHLSYHSIITKIPQILNDLPSSFNQLITVCSENPIYLVLIVASLVLKQYFVFRRLTKPKATSTNVLTIKDREHYEEVVAEAEKLGAIIVIDFSTKQQQSRVGSKHFAELSLQYCKNQTKCQFWHVDIDTIPEAVKANNIVKSPVFKFFKDNEEVDELVEWSEDELVEKIERHLNLQAINNESKLKSLGLKIRYSSSNSSHTDEPQAKLIG